jgi:phage terminase large subunit
VTYAIVQASENSTQGLRFYGGAREFWAYHGPEAMLEGPFETGKTLATLTKLHALLCKYPNARALMTRKTYNSLVDSAVVTYEKKVLPYPPDDERCAVKKYGGEKPEFYDYPNGSRIVVKGLDNAGKALSAEYDYIYVNQAEELTLHEWEILTGRATGRAGNVPYPQIFGDCNPGPSTHWILHRPRLKKFRQLHEHNPTLYNQQTGEITEQGERTMAVLNALTGVRYKRGRLGLWVAAEGQVYEDFDPDVHVIKRKDQFPIPASWRRYRAIDFGFINPFVCGWWAADEDGRLYLYREVYMTRRTVKVHSEHIKRLSSGERFDFTVSDHDAEDRATLHENGIQTVAAKKDISVGIQAVQERLKIQADGRPRLYVFEGALVEADTALYKDDPGDSGPVCTEQEFTNYIWTKTADGKPDKEVPQDLFNHGMDMMRYIVMALEHGSGMSIGKAPKALEEYFGGIGS